jgi:hypothetical protein
MKKGKMRWTCKRHQLIDDTDDKFVETSSRGRTDTYTFRDYASHFLRFPFRCVYACMFRSVVDCKECFSSSSSSFLLLVIPFFFYLNKIFSLLLHTYVYVFVFAFFVWPLQWLTKCNQYTNSPFVLSSPFLSCMIILVLSPS